MLSSDGLALTKSDNLLSSVARKRIYGVKVRPSSHWFLPPRVTMRVFLGWATGPVKNCVFWDWRRKLGGLARWDPLVAQKKPSLDDQRPGRLLRNRVGAYRQLQSIYVYNTTTPVTEWHINNAQTRLMDLESRNSTIRILKIRIVE